MRPARAWTQTLRPGLGLPGPAIAGRARQALFGGQPVATQLINPARQVEAQHNLLVGQPRGQPGKGIYFSLKVSNLHCDLRVRELRNPQLGDPLLLSPPRLKSVWTRSDGRESDCAAKPTSAFSCAGDQMRSAHRPQAEGRETGYASIASLDCRISDVLCFPTASVSAGGLRPRAFRAKRTMANVRSCGDLRGGRIDREAGEQCDVSNEPRSGHHQRMDLLRTFTRSRHFAELARLPCCAFPLILDAGRQVAAKS
jgi:hypothetical protein